MYNIISKERDLGKSDKRVANFEKPILPKHRLQLSP